MVERSPRPVGSPDETDRQRVAAHTTASGAPATVELAASGLVLAGEPLAASDPPVSVVAAGRAGPRWRLSSDRRRERGWRAACRNARLPRHRTGHGNRQALPLRRRWSSQLSAPRTSDPIASTRAASTRTDACPVSPLSREVVRGVPVPVGGEEQVSRSSGAACAVLPSRTQAGLSSPPPVRVGGCGGFRASRRRWHRDGRPVRRLRVWTGVTLRRDRESRPHGYWSGTSGGGSLTASQYVPSCRIVSENWSKLTGLRT